MANLCVAPAASGTADGSDWDNAFGADVLRDGSLVRGNTYYLSDGAYGYTIFSTANSGTTLITIKKATIAEHGPSDGWVDAMGDGQAVFDSAGSGQAVAVDFQTDYWVLDGATRTTDRSGHGIKLTSTTDLFNAGSLTGARTSITLRFIEAEGDGIAIGSVRVGGIGSATMGSTGLTLQYCYFHDMFGVFVGAIGVSDLLVEYCVFARNKNTGSFEPPEEPYPDWHSEGMSLRFVNDMTIRYCVWEDIQGTAVIVSLSGISYDWWIYGNLFVRAAVGHGIVSDNQVDSMHDIYIYNNTTVNSSSASLRFLNPTADIVAINNLWYGCTVINFNGVTGGDYNYWSLCTEMSFGEVGPNQPPVVDGESTITSDPFVNVAAGDFRLATPLAGYPGTALGAPYDTDGLSSPPRTRGADGVWDRGAYEYSVEPGPPVNVTPPVITGVAEVGETAGITPGTYSGTEPITLAYRWQKRCP